MKRLLSLALALALGVGMTIPVAAGANTLEHLIVNSNLQYTYMRMAEEGFFLTGTDTDGDGYGETRGLADASGAAIDVPAGYEIVTDGVTVSQGMFIVRQAVDGRTDAFKYGFMDTSGRLVVPLQYDRVGAFSHGLAAVYYAHPYQEELAPGFYATSYTYEVGFIDRTGKLVIPMIYEGLSSTTMVDTGSGASVPQSVGFSEGLISAQKDGNWGVIDTQGRTVLPFKYNQPIGSFHDGLASFTSNGKSGFLDQTGKVVVPATYDSVTDFSEGYAIVANRNPRSQDGAVLCGAVNTQGTLVVPMKYAAMDGFRGGMARVSDQTDWGGKYGFVDTSGNLVVPIQYTTAHSFSNGLALVALDDERFSAPIVQARYGYINTRGEVAIPLKYSYATSFIDGIAVAHLNQPDHVGSMGGHSSSAQFDGAPQYVYLDTKGNEVLSYEAGNYHAIQFSGQFGVVSSRNGRYSIVKNPCYGAAPAATTVGDFTDVATSAYYADAVTWAVEKNITSGTSGTTFSPDTTCTTAQILTFLWRANGSPEPTLANPFQDVSDKDYFAKAALWAHETALVSGDTFDGSAPCTRSMTVTYLWKLAGSPVSPGGGFTDVSTDAEYAQAVSWAVAQTITSGTSATTFSPDATCTRGQIVTFLYRNDTIS